MHWLLTQYTQNITKKLIPSFLLRGEAGPVPNRDIMGPSLSGLGAVAMAYYSSYCTLCGQWVSDKWINPNSIELKYSFNIIGGGNFYHVSVFTSLLVKKYFLKILNWDFFVMTKAVTNREICFIKAVLLLYEHGHFFLNRKLCFLLPPNTIRVKNVSKQQQRLCI